MSVLRAHGSDVGTAALVSDLATLGAAGACVAAYLVASQPLRRGTDPALPPWRLGAFALGCATAAAAVSTPVEHVAEEVFWAHMLQHLVLAFVAAPGIVLGRPVLVAGVLVGPRALGVTRPLRRMAVRARASTGAAAGLVLLHVGPWIVWHVPAGYELALSSGPVHVAEHATMVASGAALTWLVVRRGSPTPAFLAIVLGMAVMGLVAATLAFSDISLYDGHDAPGRGLTALEDQQIGGALMWFPGSLAYLVGGGAAVLLRLRPGAAARPTPAGPDPHRDAHRLYR